MTLQIDSANFSGEGIDLHNLSSGYVTDTDIGRLKAVIDCRQQGFLGITNVVNYIGNHDHDRMLVELGTVLMLVSVNRNYYFY
jgi:hypothetical protein